MIEFNANPSRRELQQFAAIWFPAFWALVGVLVYWRGNAPTIACWIWGVALLITVIGCVRPSFMRCPFVGMLAVTFPIGWVVSHVVLGVTYYAVLTPIGLIMRLLGRDPLSRRFESGAESYWVTRKSAPGTQRYFRQF